MKPPIKTSFIFAILCSVFLPIAQAKTAPSQISACGKGNVLYQHNGKKYCEKEADFFAKFDVAGINRIPIKDFLSIPQYKLIYIDKKTTIPSKQRLFTRFNMGVNGAIPGKYYLVLPILKSGHDNSAKGYKAPLLSTDQALIYRADKIENHISYEQLQKRIQNGQFNFKNSVSSIKDINSLEHVIIDQRYATSRPDLNREERYQQGVAIVWLSLIGWLDKQGKPHFIH